MTVCRICDNSDGNRTHIAREMMFGYRDAFEYFECAHCGCLQIKEIPKDLHKYYPADYYSYRPRDHKRYNALNRFISARRTKYWLGGQSLIGKLATLGRKKEPPYFIDWIKRLNLKFDQCILDVGSGTGELLIDMRQYGFRNLIGIDPFIKEDISYKYGLNIFKKDIYDLKGAFDLIILNGSFEHMPNPLDVMKKVSVLLKPKGCAFFRIPLASTFAWRKYGVNWIQLDAPRHLFLHTIKSMRMLAHAAGLALADTVFDSYDVQFWGSEQYIKGIPLMDDKSYMVNPKNSIFLKEQIEDYKRKSYELNNANDGDQARFYIYKQK